MRVLVIGNEPDLLRLLEQALQEDGYAVETARDGEAALEPAYTLPYDAIVLDLLLPGLADGWQRLAELRGTRAIPVLVLTARDALADRVSGHDSGADDYLIKPFALAELSARVRSLIRRSNERAEGVIHFGEIDIDTAARQVRRAGQVVPLTGREYAIVERLALFRGQVVSPAELYGHLVDEEDDGLQDLLEVHVASLRRKLGSSFIETLPHQGYLISG